MAGLFDTLGTATRGLKAVQTGIATTGHNISNVNTPGYTRQHQVLRSASPQPSAQGNVGAGVESVGIERVIDLFQQGRMVTETSRKAGLQASRDTWVEIESILNDQQVPGISDDVAALFDAVDALASSETPQQPLERQAVVAAARTLIGNVQSADGRLRELQRAEDRAITQILPEINALSAQIADLNLRIAEMQGLGTPNDLLDQRDQLVLEFAEKIEVTVLDGPSGMISVQLPGGLSLVDGTRSASLRAVVNPAAPNPLDPTFSQVYYESGNVFFDATNLLRGEGELGAAIENRDNVITGAIRELDAFVYTFVDAWNSVHRAGTGLTDDVARDFFADLSGQPSIDDAANNFALAAEIDPDLGGNLANIAAGGLGPTAPGLGAAVGDVENAIALGELRTDRITAYLAGDTPGAATGGSRSLMAQISGLVGEVGRSTRFAEQALIQQTNVLDSVTALRDQVSAVNMDEEVASLVSLQASFQANARVIATVNRLLDDLFSSL